MKKRILLLSIALVSFTAFSFAADAPAISKNVIVSFNKQFSDARDIKWEHRASFDKAQFTINDMVLFAYYNNNGELLAVTRYISPKHLPLQILTSLKKDYTGYWISDLFEIHTDAGTDYFATLENGDQITVLKSEGTNGWQIFQKEKKNNAE
jgi:hypothetical protein